MARWQLTEPHYLNVPGTKWEMTINDRKTNRPVRRTYNVPMHLHPDIEADWTRRDGEEGIITVCHEGKGHSDGKDIPFVGEPTPGMLPLDEEAEAISAKFKWKPTAGLDDVSQSESHTSKILGGLIDQLTDIKVKASETGTIPGMDKFMETMTAMMVQNQQILMLLAGKVASPETAPVVTSKAETAEEEFARLGKELGLEPVIDTEPPLPPIVVDKPRASIRR